MNLSYQELRNAKTNWYARLPLFTRLTNFGLSLTWMLLIPMIVYFHVIDVEVFTSVYIGFIVVIISSFVYDYMLYKRFMRDLWIASVLVEVLSSVDKTHFK